MWVPVTLAAAVFQILRTERQHELRHTLGATGAGFVRYLYGMPLAWMALVAWFGVRHVIPPVPPRSFWPWILAAAIAQIVATVALLRSFRARDFAIGTVYAKSEVILVAAFSALLLGERLGPLGWLGAAACMLAVAWLASGGSPAAILTGATDPAAVLGVVAGALFGIAAIGIRAASSALGDEAPIDRALVTLTVMLTVQVALNGAYLVASDRPELSRTIAAWRPALSVGALSLAGSMGWALAVTLEHAAKVRTLGQVELLLAFAIARVRHGDRHAPGELVAGGVVLAGVGAVAWFG